MPGAKIEVEAVAMCGDDDRYNAFITCRAGRGEAGAAVAARRLLVKDLIDTAGIRTTYGSRIYADHVPAELQPPVSGSSTPAPSSSARRICTSSRGA